MYSYAYGKRVKLTQARLMKTFRLKKKGAHLHIPIFLSEILIEHNRKTGLKSTTVLVITSNRTIGLHVKPTFYEHGKIIGRGSGSLLKE